MKVKYNDKEVELKINFRGLLKFENKSGDFTGNGSLNELLTLFYCILVASSKDESITFDNFIDWIDENSELVPEFSEWSKTVFENNILFKKK